MDKLLNVLPERAREKLSAHERLGELIEVVIDLGRPMEARFSEGFEILSDESVAQQDIDGVLSRIGEFDRDNRAGIERTLHRISGMRNRHGTVVGLTCRVGRAVFGTIDIIRDVIEKDESILFLGPPGIGKTTKLREVARILADQFGRRVVIVDTNNEIGGDGDVPHPAVGRARRMQVPNDSRQHDIMIQAVENHMPEVVVIDEIGNEAEAAAARTIAERGVQLIGTAHGNTLENLMVNPTLSDLVGGIETVTLGDDEARRRGTQKAVLERKAPPTFEVAVQLQGLDELAIYDDVASTIDRILAGKEVFPEMRRRKSDGEVKVVQTPRLVPVPMGGDSKSYDRLKAELAGGVRSDGREPGMYLRGVTRAKAVGALKDLRVNVRLVGDPEYADIILTTEHRLGEILMWDDGEREIITVRSNTYRQIHEALQDAFGSGDTTSGEEFALQQVDEAIEEATQTNRSVELLPQNAYIRRLQHELAGKHNFRSGSVGKEPRRRVVIHPS